MWETLLDLPNEVAEDAPDAELNIWNNGLRARPPPRVGLLENYKVTSERQSHF